MKIKLSREDAVSMLNRWKDGSTRISGTITSGGVLVRFIGYVSEVSEAGLKIVQAVGPPDDSERFGEISIPFSTAEEFISDASERIDDEVIKSTASMLQINLAPFITVAMFKYVRDDSPPKYRM